MKTTSRSLLSLVLVFALAGCSGGANVDSTASEELPFFSTDGFEPYESGNELEVVKLLGEDYCKDPVVYQEDKNVNIEFELACANALDPQEDTYRVYVYVTSEIMLTSLSEWVCPGNAETPVLFGKNWYLPYESWMGSIEIDPAEFQERLGGKLGTLGDVASCQS